MSGFVMKDQLTDQWLWLIRWHKQ